MKVYNIILRGFDQIDFPRNITRFINAKQKMYIEHIFLAGMLLPSCKDNPVERLGYQKDGIFDIKKPEWFQVKKK